MDRRTMHYAAALAALVVAVVAALGVKTARSCPSPYVFRGPETCVQLLMPSAQTNPVTGLPELVGGERYAEPYVDQRLPLRAAYVGAGLMLAFVLAATARADGGQEGRRWISTSPSSE